MTPKPKRPLVANGKAAAPKAATTLGTLPLGTLPAGAPDPNIEWLAEVRRAVETIKACAEFGADICTAPALPLVGVESELAGFQAPYVESIALTKGKTKSSFSCGVNALWASPLMSVTPGVPLLPAAIKELMTTMFPNGPAPLEHTISFKAEQNGTLKFGEALRVSPEEPQHALVLKIATRITEGADVAELREWKRVLLSCPGRVVFLDTDDDVYFYLTNARIKALTSARAMAHKTSQIIIDIYNFKVRKESVMGALSASRIAEFYKDCRVPHGLEAGGF